MKHFRLFCFPAVLDPSYFVAEISQSIGIIMRGENFPFALPINCGVKYVELNNWLEEYAVEAQFRWERYTRPDFRMEIVLVYLAIQDDLRAVEARLRFPELHPIQI